MPKKKMRNKLKNVAKTKAGQSSLAQTATAAAAVAMFVPEPTTQAILWSIQGVAFLWGVLDDYFDD